MKKYLIIANGKSPKKEEILPFIEDGYMLVCADGGANSAYKMGLIPDFIVGDFDSIKPKVKKFFKDFSKLVKIDDQNSTDVQKSMEFVIKNGAKEVILVGLGGSRFDHILYNFLSLPKYLSKVDIAVIRKKEVINLINSSVEFECESKERISILTISGDLHVKSKGLKYKIDGKNIQSISNVTTKERVSLKLAGKGALAIIRELRV